MLELTWLLPARLESGFARAVCHLAGVTLPSPLADQLFG